MPKPRPPNLHRETNRHGKTVWYVRINRGPRIRIRGEYGSPEFRSAYSQAMVGDSQPRRLSSPLSGSIAWLIDRYRSSGAWANLAPATRKNREYHMLKMIDAAGDKSFAAVTRARIEDGRDKLRDKPWLANDWLKAMKALFGWARQSGIVRENPCEGVRGIAAKTEGYHVWTDQEIARFEAHWPVGTRERLALAILLFTGLRRGDAANLGWRNIHAGIISIRTGKTNQPVVIPLLPELQSVLANSPLGRRTFIANLDGSPMRGETFSHWFRLACNAAECPGSAHGLRKAGATRMANAGATEAELEACFGWRGGQMASLYTRNANRVKLARGAMGKLLK